MTRDLDEEPRSVRSMLYIFRRIVTIVTCTYPFPLDPTYLILKIFLTAFLVPYRGNMKHTIHLRRT